jgi:V-type H+-transporting ATPase subunit F
MVRKGRLNFAESRNLIALLGDEDTVTGFLLTGIGERNHRGEANFFIVEGSTPHAAIQAAFTRFIERTDVAIVIVTQVVKST